MPAHRPPRPLSVLASVLGAGLMLTVAGCTGHITPLGPDPDANMPPPHHLRSPFTLEAMRVQPPTPAGRCPAGYAALPGANSLAVRVKAIRGGPGVPRAAAQGVSQCYRKTGTPLTITSAAVSPVSLQKPPPGQKAPVQYQFIITLPAADVPALTALTTTAYHARGALAISVAGKTWALPMVAGPFRGPQLQIPMPSRSQALQLQRMLAPSG
jgi:hypothetical protein